MLFSTLCPAPHRVTTVIIFLLMTCVPASGWSDKSERLNARAGKTLKHLHGLHPSALELTAKASGVLVFPRITNVGFGLGFQAGRGVLLIGGVPKAYFKVSGFSFGFKAGIKNSSQVFLFMSDPELERFLSSKGWKHGLEASVAFAQRGAGSLVDSHSVRKPIVSYFFNNRGFMANLSYGARKLTKVDMKQ